MWCHPLPKLHRARGSSTPQQTQRWQQWASTVLRGRRGRAANRGAQAAWEQTQTQNHSTSKWPHLYVRYNIVKVLERRSHSLQTFKSQRAKLYSASSRLWGNFPRALASTPHDTHTTTTITNCQSIHKPTPQKFALHGVIIPDNAPSKLKACKARCPKLISMPKLS